MESAIYILLISLAVLAILHFIYEAIILPTIRWNLRNELFSLRDKLRNVVINKEQYDPATFELAHSGINHFINRLHHLDLRFQFKYSKLLKESPELSKEVESKITLMQNCKNETIKTAFFQTSKILQTAFTANIGANFFYLVPIVIFFLILKKISNLLIKTVLIPSKLLIDFSANPKAI